MGRGIGATTKVTPKDTLKKLHAWCKPSDCGDLLSDLLAKGPVALAAAGIKGPDKTVYYVERK